jgi:defect in organelle trafficking protein DotA
MKISLRLLFVFLLSVIYAHVFADNNPFSFDGSSFGLNPPGTDQSIVYLGEIFGQVGDVLHGSGTQVMGIMFGAFNKAVVVLGIIIFTYIYGKGVLDTAAHGEFLGKQANSLWVPIRSIIGIALMIPKASTGYCVIQVFILYVVIQGVGAADMMWTKTLSYISQNNFANVSSAKNMSKIMNAGNASKIASGVEGIFQSLVCLDVLGKNNKGSQHLKFNGSDEIDFNYKLSGGAKLDCGSISWGSTCPAGFSASQCKSFKAEAQSNLINIIDTFKPIAAKYVTYDNYPTYYINDSNATDPNGQSLFDYAGSNFIRQAIVQYIQTMQDAVFEIKPPKTQSNKSFAASESEGWISAGSLYYDLGQSDKQNTQQSSFASSSPDKNDVNNYLKIHQQDSYGNAKAYATNLYSGKNVISQGASNSDAAGQSSKNKVGYGFGVASAIVTAGTIVAAFLAPPLAAVGILIVAVMGAFTAAVEGIMASTSLLNPILTLQGLGHGILLAVSIAWIAMLSITFLTALGSNIMDCMQPVGYAMTNSIGYIRAGVMALLAALFSIGALLAVYIPMLPFIYFTFGVMSWLIAVIESMIAAPIVALGVIHPEGHDFWGKAEPAVMLVLNVFLRPSLMLFGLIAGMLLSFVGVKIISVAYGDVMWSVSSNGGWLADPIEFILYLCLYMILVIAVITQSFKLITEIPNRVLQWLGFQGQLGGNMDEAIGSSKQQFQGASQQGEQSFGGSQNAASDANRGASQETGGKALADKKGAMKLEKDKAKEGNGPSSSAGTSGSTTGNEAVQRGQQPAPPDVG